MKRILSVFLTVAMLASMLAMAVSAYDEDVYNSIDNENVMSFKITDTNGNEKTNFEPGETIWITANMDSIWGDPEIEDDVKGYEGNVLPGAYGMAILTSTLVFPTDVFTPKAGKDIKSLDSTINNAGIDPTTEESYEMNITKTSLSDAKTKGMYVFLTESDLFNGDEDQYAFFTGSGLLCRWVLTVNENAANGTYKLPIGAYKWYDGGATKYEFFGNEYGYAGHSDSQLNDRPVNFTSPTGEYVNDDPTQGAYITIKVGAEATAEEIAAAEAFDAMVDAIGTVTALGTATRIDAINYDALYTHTGDVNINGGNFSIKFKMLPGTNNADGFGFFGGWTAWNTSADVIFWNNATKQFMIGAANGPVNATEVLWTKAESPVLDLPTDVWTDVEFIYNGSYMAVKVNGVIACETNEASTGYDFYIFYPSDVDMYITDMTIGDYDYDAFLVGYNANAYTTVELDSGAAIAEAEAAYAALTPAAKALVENYDALVAARAEYDELAAKTGTDAIFVDTVINMIANIGDVLFNPVNTALDSGAAITAAEDMYAQLSDESKALVTNYETLVAARAEYESQIDAYNMACAYDVDVLIDAIGEVNFNSRAAIEAAEAAYAALTDAQKAYVTKYDVLVAARATYDQYAPIMNVEVLADALGSDFFQGQYLKADFTSSNGYAQLPGVADNNFTFTTTFVYTAANVNTGDDSNIGLFRSDASFAGYDFCLGAFIIGQGGAFMSGNKTPEVFASTEYDLVPGKVYTMTIEFADGVGSVYLDGELMVTGNGVSASGHTYAIFYPMNSTVYFESIDVNGTAMGASDFVYGCAVMSGIDVIAPVDIEAKLVAAEEALAALDADQLALLDDKYEQIIADARANFDAKYAELVAAAEAVDAQIDAIATDADITAARAAYDALLPGAKPFVTGLADLEAANSKIVVNMIANIGDVTPASEVAIAAAEAAYAKLTDAEKALVDNYGVLTDARAEINAQYVAIANAQNAIGMLQAGGFAIVNNADGGSKGSYSQFLDNAEILSGDNAVAEYAFSFDIYVDRLNDETNAYFGGSSSNNVFVGYDLVRKTVFVANDGPWGYNSAAETVIAEAEFDLQLQTWYDFKFVMGETTAQIYVDGELVLETAITEPNGWFIYYPKNNVAYYDNIEFWYNGEKQTSMSTFATVGAGNWTALGPVGDPGYYLTDAAPVGPIDADADLIAAARAAYDAVPAKAQAYVANYDLLVAAEEAANPVDPDAEAKAAAAEIDALIAAIGTVTLDSDAAIAAAREAYDANEAAQAFVTELATLEAAEAELKALKVAADKAEMKEQINVAPQNVTATANDKVITITWDAVDGAAKYWVMINGTCFLSTTGTSVDISRPYGEYEITVKVALKATYGTVVYAAGTSAPVPVSVVKPATTFKITEAGVVDNKVQVKWNAAEGAAKYWVIFTAEDGTTYTFATTTTEFARKVAPFKGNYSVIVKALVSGKFVDTAAAEFAC